MMSTYLYFRANAGCATMINGLIDCGANVNATMSDSIMKCLHVLVAHGNQEIQEGQKNSISMATEVSNFRF